VRFAVWVWSTRATSKSVTVTVTLGHVRHVTAPHFTVCPSADKARCVIGTLPKGQADELQAASWVRATAASGEQIQLTASATGKDARAYQASGSVEVTSATPTTSVSIKQRKSI